MRDRNEGGARRPSGLRYIPATLAAAASVSALILIPALTSWIRPWFYGMFLGAAGPPAPSRLVALVVPAGDAGGTGEADPALLARAILAHEPSVLALDLAEPPPADFLSASPGGPVVLGLDFGSLGPDPGPVHPASGSLPHVLARSTYPHLEGSGTPVLPRGDVLRLPEDLALRSATGAFAGPLQAPGTAYAFPAFARCGRAAVAGLGVEAARRALGVPAASVNYVEGVGILFDPAHILPVDGDGRMHLRFHGAEGIPSVPASRILDGSVRPEEIRGKIVVVSAAGKPPVRTVAGYLSPGEIWATALSNLLERSTVSAPAWGRLLALSMGLAFAAILVAIHFADIGLLATAFLAALLMALYPLLSLLLFVKSSWWLPPELPIFLVPGAWLPFAAVRLLSPGSSRAAAPPIRPAPVYDPLVAMGGGATRPRSGPGPSPKGPVPGPLAGPVAPAPAQPQAPAQAQAPAPPASIMPPAPPRAPFAPAVPPAATPAGYPPQARPAPAPDGTPRPKPQAGRERQGPIAPPTPGRAPSPEAPAPASAPAHAPAFAPAQAPASPAAPVSGAGAQPPAPAPVGRPAEHPHTGTIADDIERDAKGGLVRVGKYRIVRKMGFGSGGDVFEGYDTHMGRKVAIKTITKDAASHFDRAAERFVVEAKAAGSLNHPCINTIYDFGNIRDVSYMVLEFLDGITLSQWMRQHPVPHPRQVSHWVQQICSALDYAHSQKVIHRDLKPANLMIVHGGATIKLLDFGIAKLEDVGLTQTGMTVGTPSYMSPEQLTGAKVTAASDQYGLAVVLYQLFTYRLPYQGTKIPELCNRILKNDLIPLTEANPSLDPGLWEALRKAMAKSPEDRYPNCMALFQALEAGYPSAQSVPA